MEIKRKGNRPYNQMREIKITKGFLKYASGSCLIEIGDTKVICAVNYEDKVPQWLKDTGNGWITAEYSLIPSSTQERIPRSSISSGRTQEIQRMIGRSLRGVVDLKRIGERTFWVDCDVIQADGGTRVAGVIGGFIALVECLSRLKNSGLINVPVLKNYLGAISVGIVHNNILLDLDYAEDSIASVDLNVVMTGSGEFIEIQGTAEGYPFTKKQLDQLLSLAEKGINEIIEIEKEILKDEIMFLLGD
ncbi:MAG: ribonuclease PH [Candidatus Omnitrophica bacterium]|nr:ribonuclease PH [Candidatus Omnitrophota bacterium]MCM8803170.1 ribonuclease PH [Candidatus Omnitrophota bacterium]